MDESQTKTYNRSGAKICHHLKSSHVLLVALLTLHCGFRAQTIALAPKRITAKPISNITGNHQSDKNFIVGRLSSDLDNSSTRSPANFVTGLLAHGVEQLTPKQILKLEKKQEPSSTDCIAKREEIIKKIRSGIESHYTNDHPTTFASHSLHHQRLRPKQDSSSIIRAFNSTPDSGLGIDNAEHIPQCTPEGRYEPTQCWIGYCWCVNKFGQAIKNSAASVTDKPICDSSLYESESNDLLVVTGVSAHRIKNFLRPSEISHSDNVSSHANHETAQRDLDGQSSRDPEESEFSRRVGSSPEPSLALVPNECALSRENAIERKMKHSDLDNIWIPECDLKKEKLYAERQCHKARVCWCVDQETGLPLRTSEQLTKTPSINCTEIRRIIEIASTVGKQDSQRMRPSFFHGFSESCHAEKRSEFVHFLIGQFRQQLGEYMKKNSTNSPPSGIPSSNPYKLTEYHVSIWRFSLLDMDFDGKLDDREWSKFKVNFKLVDKLDSQTKPIYPHQDMNMSPLYILRSQRRCWRDFLEFCGNGDVLADVSIDQTKWLSCTELPSGSTMFSPMNDRPKMIPPMQNPEGVPDAYTRAAAIARSKMRNPFLGILKPD